jgi:ABC-type phosphate transport system permease subunit
VPAGGHTGAGGDDTAVHNKRVRNGAPGRAGEYRGASLALGATEIETVFRVALPAARSGIAAAVVLGVGRAIGEAMAIIMVSGNVANMPGLFTSVRFLTTAIASGMSYAAYGSLYRNALFSIGLVLFLFIMLINVLLNRVHQQKGGLTWKSFQKSAGLWTGHHEGPDVLLRRHHLRAAAGAHRLYLYRGVPHLTWQLVSGVTSYLKNTIGILPNILNTLYIIM